MGGLTVDQVVLLIMAFLGVVALSIILGFKYLTRQQELQKSRIQDPLGPRVMYESRESAARAIEEKVKEDIYWNNYFPVKIKCENCHLSGPLLIPRGQRTSEEPCPKCYVSMLEVTAASTNGDKPLYYPVLPQDLEEGIEGEVERLVEEAWDLGQIKRREGMFIP